MAKLEEIPDGLRLLRLIPSVAEPGTFEIPFDATVNVDATGIGFAEDSVATSTDVGIPALAVRRDTASSAVSADGDYAMLSVDSLGRLRVGSDTAAAAICKAEDAAAASGDAGVAMLVVRRDTASSGVGTDGDYASPHVDANGRLRVIDDSRPSAFTSSFASADTSAHAFSAQAVKTPVTVIVNPAVTGTVTIADATNGGVVLDVTNRGAVFYCANLNELKYTFSVHAGTEKFGISCGI